MPGLDRSSLALLAFAASAIAQSTYGSENATALSGSPFTGDGFNNPQILLSKGGHAICIDGIVPVQANATNAKLSLQEPANVGEATQDILNLVTAGSDFGTRIVTGQQPVSGTWNISGRLCVPVSKPNASSVQVLTHGIGFDKSYWDFAPGYSYVDSAAVAGYATFLYDRLGCGASDHPDAIQTVQAPLEVAILARLTGMARAGSFAKRSYARAIVVGHSFGSVLTAGALAVSPSLADAAVLTGFSSNASGIPAFTLANNLDLARSADPYRFGNLSSGYLLAGNARAVQTLFFIAPFDPAIVSKANAEGQTITLGEAVTQFGVLRRTNFTGPVAIVDGDRDLAFCSGNCTYQVDKPRRTLVDLFPQARNGTTYLAKNTGHGLSLQYAAEQAYQFVFSYLAGSGLSP